MLDEPVSGRVFFEQVIRDNLDIGRPDQVGRVFDRRCGAGPARHAGAVPHPGDRIGHQPTSTATALTLFAFGGALAG